MAELRPFCPQCTSLEVEFGVIAQEADGGRPAKCLLCGWEGMERDIPAAAVAKDFWDIEKVGHVLLIVFAKHGVGPLVQALEYVGLVDPDDVEGKEEILDRKSVV